MHTALTAPATYFEAFKNAPPLLFELKLTCLPQLRLQMLQQRVEELAFALRECLPRVLDGAAAKQIPSPANRMPVLAAARPMLSLLDALHSTIQADIDTAQQRLSAQAYAAAIDDMGSRLPALLRRFEACHGDPARQRERELIAKETAVLYAAMEHLEKRAQNLQEWADPRIAEYCANVDAIFTRLEQLPLLVDLLAEALCFLRAVAYKHIAADMLFSGSYYLKQLGAAGTGVSDALAHYLSSARSAEPCPYFDSAFYQERYPEVRLLRYSPLEHFSRYGDSLLYAPHPDFDPRYYLFHNDDVLATQVTPFRHFLKHGSREGRPPAATAYFMDTSNDGFGDMNVAFVGEAQHGEATAWEAVRTRFLADARCKIEHFAPADWSAAASSEKIFIFGGQAAERINTHLLQTLSEHNCRLVYLGQEPKVHLRSLMHQSFIPSQHVCAITPHYGRFLNWQQERAPLRLHYYPFDIPGHAVVFLEALKLCLLQKQNFGIRRNLPDHMRSGEGPCISVVSIIYKKAQEMLCYLESLNRQDVAHPYEVILVDDASPDVAVHTVETWLESKKAAGLLNTFMDVRILRNAKNSGNCVSRNVGLEFAKADIVMVTDGDVALSASCLSEHLWAYRYGDCDAAIGYFKFDLTREQVFHWLAGCEIRPSLVPEVIAKAERWSTEDIGMRMLPASIYNFVTRNVSFKKSACGDMFFDTAFSYCNAPDSGYGEEDHELGARFYFSGKRIRFLENAISVHIRHQDNSNSPNKILANLRNWNRLVEKHPDLVLLNRPYYRWRTNNFLRKAIKNAPTAPEVLAARAVYEAPRRAEVRIPRRRRLRILSYKWHVPHQYELFKMMHDVTLVTHNGTVHCDQWDYGQRPCPYNVRFAALERIDPRDYDFAILPFDEYVLSPEYCPTLTPDWGNAFRAMLTLTEGMPRVALCHGSPPICEAADHAAPEPLGQPIAALRTTWVNLLKTTHVVCNSHQAQKEWGFARSSVIWHGFSPEEFPLGRHRQDCLTLGRLAYDARPFYRGMDILHDVQRRLQGRCAITHTKSPEPHPNYPPNTQEWAVAKFQNYVRYIGDFKMYFNPTVRSPMPRSRAEAMLTGSIPVVLNTHDADMFIKQGVNGYYGNNAEELTEYMLWILQHETERQRMSREARLTAMDTFNIDRNLAAWMELISSLC